RTIDQSLPFDASGLSDEDTAYSFFYASDGIIGWIMKLIRYAAREAIQMQAATLSRSLLAAAYNACITNTTISAGKVNPFATPVFHLQSERELFLSKAPSSSRTSSQLTKRARKPVRDEDTER